jgi:hypothetical protein
MKMLRRTCALASIAFVLSMLAVTDAVAKAQRTFVASNGNDLNSCSLTQPCRGFARAITQTSPGGEVIVLDSAGYGMVTITQSVSIITPTGVYAGISVLTGFDGVTVAAGATDKVALRGLTINGLGGTRGIHVTSGKETYIEDCTVANADLGIEIDGGTAVHIVRAVVRGSKGYGILVSPSGASAITTTLTDSVLTSNQFSAFAAYASIAGATVTAVATRVTAVGNGNGGGVAFDARTSNPSAAVSMLVTDSIGSETDGNGVVASGANVTAVVSGSSFVGNSDADLAQNAPAVLRTGGNNALTGRGAADISGTLTANPLK